MESGVTGQEAIAVDCAVEEAGREDLRFTHGCTEDSVVKWRRRRGAQEY
jgi:hypothetical protein